MYVVTVTFDIHPDQMEAFIPLMLTQAKTSLNDEVDCHVFDVCTDGSTVFLYEVYTDEAAFKTHLDSPHFASFDTAVSPMVAAKTVTAYKQVEA